MQIRRLISRSVAVVLAATLLVPALAVGQANAATGTFGGHRLQQPGASCVFGAIGRTVYRHIYVNRPIVYAPNFSGAQDWSYIGYRTRVVRIATGATIRTGPWQYAWAADNQQANLPQQTHGNITGAAVRIASDIYWSNGQGNWYGEAHLTGQNYWAGGVGVPSGTYNKC